MNPPTVISPALVIINLSVPPVVSATESAPTRFNPLSVSPAKLRAGFASELVVLINPPPTLEEPSEVEASANLVEPET